MKSYFEGQNVVVSFSEIAWLSETSLYLKTITNGCSDYLILSKEEMKQLKAEYNAWLEREEEIQQLTLENLRAMKVGQYYLQQAAPVPPYPVVTNNIGE